MPTETPPASDKRKLIDSKLGHPSSGHPPITLDELVAGRRRLGVSWDRISTEITQRTDEYISGESLRQWFGGTR